MIKSLIRPLSLTLCLTLVTFWLFTKSRESRHQEYDRFGQLLTLISRIDAEVNAEVLKLQFQLHNDYDRLGMLEKALAECASELKDYDELGFGRDATRREQLMRPILRKIEIMSDFKALHAVLENSVAIFHRASRQLESSLENRDDSEQLIRDLILLDRAAMEFVLLSSPASRMQVASGIELVRNANITSDHETGCIRVTLLAHASNLLRAKPEMDNLLRELYGLTIPSSIQAMQANAADVLAIANRRSVAYQLKLLGATLFLIGYCGWLIYRVGRYVTTIRQTNEQLEERVKLRTRDLEAKSEVLRGNGRFLSSVLDAMDAKICILDSDGTISATNAAWTNNATDKFSTRSGDNYLDAFVLGRRSSLGAPEVVEAIHSLRTSSEHSIVVEFSTDEDDRAQWFEARISKMMPQGPDKILGFVVALIDVTERHRTQNEKDKLNRQLQAMSRQAGMAEVATGVLHNVGNVLNSINIASTQAVRIVKCSRLASLQKAEELLQQNMDDLAGFIANDPRGQQFPNYLSQIAKTWQEEQKLLLGELSELNKHIDHVKHVINVQQEHAKVSNLNQELQPAILLEDAITTIMPSLKTAHIELIRSVDQLPIIHSDPHKIMQILVNLLSNAKHAVMDAKMQEPCILVRAALNGDSEIMLSVTDNGIGIAPENLRRICQHGFTTKKNGHGFGLHSCALLAKELGGRLEFNSPGLNQGATFSLCLPITDQCQPEASSNSLSLEQELVNVDRA